MTNKITEQIATVSHSVACEYGNTFGKQCKNKAKWHVTNGYGFDKKICTIHKNKMDRNGTISFCNPIKEDAK